MNRIKDYLSKKGFETIRSLGKTFRKMRSYDGLNKISKDDLILAFRDLGINLQKEDLEVKYTNLFYKISTLGYSYCI